MKPPAQFPVRKRSPAAAILGSVKSSYPRIQRLLVPLDFSGRSRQALRYAIPLAQKFGARIVLLHALEPVPRWAPDLPKLAAEMREAAKAAAQRLDATAATLIPKGLYERSVVAHGEPAAEILASIARHEIDLIVMSTRGRSSLKRLLLGSTAEQVMRQAGCPVLSLRRR